MNMVYRCALILSDSIRIFLLSEIRHITCFVLNPTPSNVLFYMDSMVNKIYSCSILISTNILMLAKVAITLAVPLYCANIKKKPAYTCIIFTYSWKNKKKMKCHNRYHWSLDFLWLSEFKCHLQTIFFFNIKYAYWRITFTHNKKNPLMKMKKKIYPVL